MQTTDNRPMPRVADVNGRRVLLVDDLPFLMLGLQWDCDSCFASEVMDPLFTQAAKMGANVAALPLYWSEVEPQEGRYDLTMLDHRLEQARQNGLRIVLLWFGSYKNGCLNYAPNFVKDDPARFRRAHRANGTALRNFSCPTSSATLEADRKAVEAVFRHLRQVDGQRTVILFQMENEPGLMGTDRCYCPQCRQQFEAGSWQQYGPHAAEAFTADCLARYIDSLTASAKCIYPLPVYANCWLGGADSIAGQHYPSGGPVERMLPVYRQALRHVDFIAPDIYSHAMESFRSICRAYSWPGIPLYVAEHSSGAGARAERNVFYALGELGAIGFDPWAIDRAFPDQAGPPLVHPLDGRWSEEAYDLRDSYVPLRDAMVPLAEAQATDCLRVFVQEDAAQAEVSLPEMRLQVRYHHRKAMGRGMIFPAGPGRWVVLGTGFSVRFFDLQGKAIEMLRVERGRFEGRQWKRILPKRRENEDRSVPVALYEAQVLQITLAT